MLCVGREQVKRVDIGGLARGGLEGPLRNKNEIVLKDSLNNTKGSGMLMISLSKSSSKPDCCYFSCLYSRPGKCEFQCNGFSLTDFNYF